MFEELQTAWSLLFTAMLFVAVRQIKPQRACSVPIWGEITASLYAFTVENSTALHCRPLLASTPTAPLAPSSLLLKLPVRPCLQNKNRARPCPRPNGALPPTARHPSSSSRGRLWPSQQCSVQRQAVLLVRRPLLRHHC